MKRRGTGFSLVELLAVVVIIMILLALLLPMLKNARLNGERAVCLSNLGVLGKGFVQYPPDHDGNLMVTEGNFDLAQSWVGNGPTEQDIKDGALWPYVLDLRVYRCPSHPFKNFKRHYSWNDFINGGNYAGLPAPGGWKKHGQIPFPARTLAQMDDIDPRGAGYLVGTWVIDVYNKYRYVDPVPSWHAGGMDLNFMDGHAEYWKWVDPRTLSMVTEANLNSMGAFFQTHTGSKDWWRLRQAVNPGYPDAPPPTTP
ncbi:MAG: prepilin-type N-terminal cleavage/methylation domain-containing protein [Kiritimatiellia bacterium]